MRPKLTRKVAEAARRCRTLGVAITLECDDFTHAADRRIGYAAGEEPARATTSDGDAPKGLPTGETAAEAATPLLPHMRE